jgi:hypothetical protein
MHVCSKFVALWCSGRAPAWTCGSMEELSSFELLGSRVFTQPGSDSVIWRCRLYVRVARKRTGQGDFTPSFFASSWRTQPLQPRASARSARRTRYESGRSSARAIASSVWRSSRSSRMLRGSNLESSSRMRGHSTASAYAATHRPQVAHLRVQADQRANRPAFRSARRLFSQRTADAAVHNAAQRSLRRPPRFAAGSRVLPVTPRQPIFARHRRRPRAIPAPTAPPKFPRKSKTSPDLFEVSFVDEGAQA